MSTYYQKLKSPQWQRVRLRIMERDNFTCWICGDKNNTLNIHHKTYRKGAEPWEYDDENFVTLCESCHHKSHERIEAVKNNMMNQSYFIVLDAMNEGGKKLHHLCSFAELLNSSAKSNHLLGIYMHLHNFLKSDCFCKLSNEEKIKLTIEAITLIHDDYKNNPFTTLDAMIDNPKLKNEK